MAPRQARREGWLARMPVAGARQRAAAHESFVARARTHRYNPGFNPSSILMTSAWLLPEHIADVLPSEARRIEELRRKLLDLARSYGFELVIPPMLEHLESLLSGAGLGHDLKTFKLVDQLSGRMLGVRADTTPQVARIDAHLLNRQGVARLCYCGPVLHTRPDRPHGPRSEERRVGKECRSRRRTAAARGWPAGCRDAHAARGRSSTGGRRPGD